MIETVQRVLKNFTTQLLPRHTLELHLSCVKMYLVCFQGCTLPTYTLVPGPNGKLVNYFIYDFTCITYHKYVFDLN